MYALFYDTETTGLPLFREPSEDPRQPHIVQLAAALVDLQSRAVVASIDVIIRPDGWTIPGEVAAIHGITTEMASDVGVPEEDAVIMLLEMWGGQRQLVAHNEQFDRRIVRIALHRHLPPYLEDWKSASAECTATLATPIMKLPPTPKMVAAGRHHPKTPNLGEAHQFFLERPLVNAHSAMADVQGCMDVYFAIKDWQAQQAAA